uniref:Frizzled domain-containing protein n=1 Tax=Schistocephalus solidus TaxID=70667 RepID=A0A183SKS8_SCHSO
LAFVLVYFPFLVAALWSVIFDYAVFATFRELCKRAASISPPSASPLKGDSTAMQLLQQPHQQQFYHYHNLTQRRSCWLPIIRPSFTLDSVSTCRPLLSPDTCEVRRINRGGDGPASMVGPLDVCAMGSASPVTTAAAADASNQAANEIELLPPATAVGTNEPHQASAREADANSQRISKKPSGCWWHQESEASSPFIRHPIICRLLWLHPDLSPRYELEQTVFDSSGIGEGDIALDGYQRLTESSRRRHIREFNSTPMEKQLTCVHIVLVTVPIVFVFISLTGSKIDGEPLSGLCFVGITSLWAHCALVVFPLGMCLFLKMFYLFRAMMFMSQLRSKFTESFFLVDREMAHRLVMSIRAYVIYILALLGLLLFFVGVHSYVYVQQPHWLESQRNFFFCQLRHRLMGLDVFAASVACHSSSSVFSVLHFGAVRHQAQQFPPLPPLIHSSTVTASPVTSASPRDVVMVEESQQKPTTSAHLVTTGAGRVLRRITRDLTASSSDADAPPLLSPFDPFLTEHSRGANGSGSVFEFSESARPLTGPIFLNLLTYFTVNLIFASMCLLDASVKRRWTQLFHRVVRAIYPRQSNSGAACGMRKTAGTAAASEVTSFTSTSTSCCFNGGGGGHQMLSYCSQIALDRLPPSFSWWDPGVFFLFPTRPASALCLCKLQRPPTGECAVTMSAANVETRPCQLQNHQQATSANDTSQPVRTSGSATNSSNSQNAVSLRAAVSDVSCSYGRRYSSSTNEESCIASALSSSGIGSCANQGGTRSTVTTTADRDNAACGTSIGSHGGSKFRGGVIHKSGSVNSAQSLFLRHHPHALSALGGAGGCPRVSQAAGQSDSTTRSLSAAAALAASLQPLQAVAAAAASEIDAHLTAAVALHQTLACFSF